jgi:hypothetical protein
VTLRREEYEGNLEGIVAARKRLRERDGRKAQEAAVYHLRQAEVPVQLLTQDSHWDYFLSLLQAKLETARAALAAVEGEVVPFTFEAMAERQARALAWHAQIDTLTEIMAIPSDILAGAKEAKADAGEN